MFFQNKLPIFILQAIPSVLHLLTELLTICKGKRVSINMISKVRYHNRTGHCLSCIQRFLEKEYGKEEAQNVFIAQQIKQKVRWKQLLQIQKAIKHLWFPTMSEDVFRINSSRVITHCCLRSRHHSVNARRCRCTEGILQ